jgi:hypothetical protein
VAQKTFADLDFLGSFATRHRLEDPVSSDPSGLGTGDQGRVWFNSTSKLWKYWNGTAAIDPLARGNQSGTQLSATISDLATTVQGYSLSSFAAITADLSLATHKLTNVVDPVSTQDAATKNYVDQSIAGITGGLILKGAVTCAALTNISITSAPSTIDGVTMSAGMVVLLTNQTTTTQNGPYVWASAGAAMSRATNWSTSAQATLGSFWMVEQGTNADTIAVCTNDTAITIGTTTPLFIFKTSGTTYTQGNGINIAAGVISAVQNTGVIVNGSGIGADFTVVGKKIAGIVPTTTTGIVTVSGAVVTINHGLGNYAPLVVIAAYTSPYTGFSQGDIPISGAVATDANNIQFTLPAAPASNNWVYSIIG